jgi:alkylation response protein AidB-like acyl-CoA dehydrogenase
MTARDLPTVAQLSYALARLDARAPTHLQLQTLIDLGYGNIPLPAGGQTLARWQALALVAQHDLSLAKLFESHTDARAILAELGAGDGSLGCLGEAGSTVTAPRTLGPIDAVRPAEAADATGASWGVWAAEAPGCRVLCDPAPRQPADTVRLRGTKAWCSGALHGSHALLTAWSADPAGSASPHLIAVALDQPGVQVSASDWQAVGMAGSASVQVQFGEAEGVAIGTPGDYLSRAGFWHGGAGVAACWYGGTLRIAHALHDALVRAPAARRDRFRLAAAGEVDIALQGTGLLLRQTAQWIDAHPRSDARAAALRVRLSAAACAQRVLALVGDVLGAAPFCRDHAFAQAAADLPVFIRQSHAGHDYAALGEQLIESGANPWAL